MSFNFGWNRQIQERIKEIKAKKDEIKKRLKPVAKKHKKREKNSKY